jgi:signal transduction histidine kinase
MESLGFFWHGDIFALQGVEQAGSLYMMKKRRRLDANSNRVNEYAAASQSLLRYANEATTRIEFLTNASRMILESSGCDALELSLQTPGVQYFWELTLAPEAISRFVVHAGRRAPRESAKTGLAGKMPYPANAQLRFTTDGNTAGLLRFKSLRRKFFTREKLEFCRAVAEILRLATGIQKAQWALRERVKELTCLYGISQIAQFPGLALDDALQRIVELLPPAWQFPEIARARILLDSHAYSTHGFVERPIRQVANLIIDGKTRGLVEVVYSEERPEFAESPFLAEERSLVDTIARELSLIVDKREAELHQSLLQAQLRHADRLATIGQLAAGVAHELNEPLGSILGFAQLIQKDPELPNNVASDVERIVKASLHAREVIHKLLVFSRQKKPVKTRVNLNQIVEEGLYFLESRCAKAGIAVVSSLSPDLPQIFVDTSQIHQVLVNLVVNSIQAMPEGGTLTINTGARESSVWLGVQDTGIGMSDEIKEKIYAPFFTTKDIDQGTGLGLAVVHGIVTSHGGTIHLESAPGKGTRFEIQFPAAELNE